MHTDIIEILFKSKIPTNVLYETDFIKRGLFTDHKYYVLIWDRLIVKTSSNIVGTSMNARVWLDLSISGIGQKYVCHELTFKKVTYIFGDFDLCLNHSSLLGFNFRKIVDIWLC